MRFLRQVIYLTVLAVLLTSVLSAGLFLQKADAAETDLIFEDFSDYYGGNPSGTTGGNGVGQSKIVSDFQGASYQLESNGNEQLSNTIKYDFDKPLSSGKYLLSFDIYFENAPNLENNEKGRLFICKIGGLEKKTGQTFIVGPSGYMGYNTGMDSWDAYNSEKFLYQAQKWYCVDMILNLDGDAPYIDYYIDGRYQGCDVIPMTKTANGIAKLFPITQIAFVLEDRKTSGSMYLDNVILTKADSRNLLLASEPLAGSKSIDVHLPVTLRNRSEADMNVDGFLSDLNGVSVEANGKNIEVLQIEQLTSKTFRFHLAEELPEGNIVCTVKSDATEISGDILKNGKSVSFTTYKLKMAEELLGDLTCDAKAYLSVDEIISDNINVNYEAISDAVSVKKQGVSGISIAPIKDHRELGFDIDDIKEELVSFTDGEAVEITVLYFDSGYGELSLFYDSEYLATDYGGKLTLTDTNQWKTHKFTVTSPKFSNRLDKSNDFKLTVYDYRTGYSPMPVIVAATTVKKVKTVAPIYIKSETEKIGNIFYTGEEIDFSLSYSKRAMEENISDIWQRTVRVLEYDETETDDGYNNVLWSDSKEISFLKSTKIEESLTLPKLPYGLYKLEVSVEADGYVCKRNWEFSFVKSAKDKNNDTMGVCMHYALSDWKNWNENPEPLLDIYDNAGFGWVRDNFNLNSYAAAQKDENGKITGYTYQMPTRWSEYISAANQRDMKILPIAEGGVGYTTPLYEKEKQEKFAEVAANFATELYEMGVDSFELCNEYDNSAYYIPPKTDGTINYETYYHKAKYYAQFLKEVYLKVKDVHPEFNIVGGVTANIPTSWLQVLFAEIEELGVTKADGSINPLMDVLSVHPYISYPNKSTVVSGLENAKIAIKNGYIISDSNEKHNKPYEPSEGETIVQDMQYTGDLPPVWATEFGKSTAGSSPASPIGQATHIVKQYLIARAYNTFDKMFVYSYKDNSVDAIESEAEYGIIKANRETLLDVPCAAKPSYAAIANLNWLISDTYDTDVIYEEDREKGTLIKYNQNDGSCVYALWGGSGNTLTYDFNSPVIYYYDIYGNETCMEEEDGIYIIPTASGIAYVKVPLCKTPLYTIDPGSNKLTVCGKTETSLPEISLVDLKGNKIEINLQTSDIPNGEIRYTFTAVLPNMAKDYELVLQDNNYIRRMNIHPKFQAPQLQIADARYMLAINTDTGEICVSGISNPTDSEAKYIQGMLYYPGQQFASMADIIPAWIDQQKLSDCGEYEFSFVTPMVVGDYRMVLLRGGKETAITFALEEGVELALVQDGAYIDALNKIEEDKTVAVELRISEDLKNNDLTLIIGCYKDEVLTSCSYKTFGQLTKISDMVYRFTVDGTALKNSDNVKVLLWKNIKSVSPVVKGKEFR